MSLPNASELSDEELIDLLHTEDDRLPRAVVDEIVVRGRRMVEPLTAIVKDEYHWANDGGGWWAAIHATFMLGAIGGRPVITPLLASLRFADQYECDWVFETLPAMFGRIGLPALPSLKQVAEDRSNSWFVRVTALEGMASITLAAPRVQREVFDFIVSLMNDWSEEAAVRGLAASLLLDFAQVTYHKSLLAFAEEEEQRHQADPHYLLHVGSHAVRRLLASPRPSLAQYTRDWLRFYQPDEIAARQERWRRERSWRWRIIEWLRRRWWRWRRLPFWPSGSPEIPLPQIQLTHVKRDHRPTISDLVCAVCGRRNIPLGSASNLDAEDPAIVCEECAIDAYQEQAGFASREAAAARRRRMFDVVYLFHELVVAEYLKQHDLPSVAALEEEQLDRLLAIATRGYSQLFNRQQQLQLEETIDQHAIVEQLRRAIVRLPLDSLD